MTTCSGLLVALSCLAMPLQAQSFVNFEGAATHPIRVSQDGSRLFVVDTRLDALEVFDLSVPSAPVLLRSIPCGLVPVSVARAGRSTAARDRLREPSRLREAGFPPWSATRSQAVVTS